MSKCNTSWGTPLWLGSDNVSVPSTAFGFAAKVAIAGTINHIESEIPARWLDREDGAERHAAEIAALPEGYCEQMATTAVTALGWHLSILVAQSTGEGMGVCDALDAAGLGETITNWAQDRIAGKRGIVSTGTSTGYDDAPDCDALADEWLAVIRKWCV